MKNWEVEDYMMFSLFVLSPLLATITVIVERLTS